MDKLDETTAARTIKKLVGERDEAGFNEVRAERHAEQAQAEVKKLWCVVWLALAVGYALGVWL